jgi:hypothetical protein
MKEITGNTPEQNSEIGKIMDVLSQVAVSYGMFKKYVRGEDDPSWTSDQCVLMMGAVLKMKTKGLTLTMFDEYFNEIL